MIPKGDYIDDSAVEVTLPTRTFRISDDGKRIAGYTDGIDAMKQAVRLMLNAERYEHIIYSWNYGVELRGLYGEDIGYAQSEIVRRITDALMADVRVLDVGAFRFEKKDKTLRVTFTVNTVFGTFEEEVEAIV